MNKWGIELTTSDGGQNYLLKMALLGVPTWAAWSLSDGRPAFRCDEYAFFDRRSQAVAFARKHGVYPHRKDVRIVRAPALSTQ